MRCRRARKMVSRRMDGALSSLDEAELERHLTGCASCRTQSDRLLSSWNALTRLEGPGRAPDDWARIQAALDASSRAQARWPSWALAPRLATSAWILAGMALLGATGGALASRTAHAAGRAESPEFSAFAETLGDLPWDSPAAGLVASLGAPLRPEERP